MSETIDVMPEAEIEHVRQAFADAIAAEKLSVAAASVAIGSGSSTLALWKQRKYSGDNSKITRAIQMWIDSRETKARVKSMLPEVGYVPTPTSLAFMDCLEQAQYAADMVVIAGVAGLGKTKSCIRYGQTHAQVWMMTADPSCSSALRVMGRLCDAIGVRETTVSNRPHRAIGKLTGSGGLLIVDEAQHLTVEALEQLRYVYDQSGIGLAFVGNPEVWSRLDGGGRKSHMAQLFSRVGMRVVKMRAMRKDADALLEAYEIEDEGVRRLLRVIAGKPGALRGMVKTLRVARMRASQSDDGLLTVDDVQAAWSRLSDNSMIEVQQ